VEWLIDGLIPKDHVTIFDGDPGQGKSFLSLELAAAVSRGETLTPNGRRLVGQPGHVLILNAEDDVRCTMIPRLQALSANMSFIRFLTSVPSQDGRGRPLLLPDDAPHLEDTVCAWHASLVIVDPIMAYLAERVRTQSDQAVRLALRCLKEMAEKRQCTVILIRHLNKSGDAKVLYRGGGSIGIIALARAAFYVGPNPENPVTKLFAQVKNNLGPLAKPWIFSLVTGPQNLRRIEWQGVSDVPLSRLIHVPDDKLPIEIAQEFLRRRVKPGKPVLVRDVIAAAKAEHISQQTLIRARRKLGMIFFAHGHERYWGWPGDEPRDPLEAIRREAKLVKT
jgi:hypothetical protein